MRAIDLVKRKVVYPLLFYMVITPFSMTEMAKYEIEEKRGRYRGERWEREAEEEEEEGKKQGKITRKMKKKESRPKKSINKKRQKEKIYSEK